MNKVSQDNIREWSAGDISAALAERAEVVVPMLYPNGKKIGHEWCIGGVEGQAGTSMKIALSGGKAGKWADFASDEHGDILDLWCVAKGISLTKAIIEAKAYLKIPMAKGAAGPSSPKKWKEPKLDPKTVRRAADEKRAADYLVGTRKLDPATVRRYRLGLEGDFILFPSFTRDPKLAAVKYIGIARTQDGKKIVKTAPNCPPMLFGWQAIPDKARTLLISEGEIDAMTWAGWGVSAVSVPFGAENHQWIQHEWDNLEIFDEILLAYDQDKVGLLAVKDVARRLGLHRCRIVKTPKKDANGCLQAGATAADAAKWIAEAKPLEPDEIRTMLSVADAVIEYFYPTSKESSGFAPALFEGNVSFRPGEWTCWTGYTSEGKTTFLNYLVAASMPSEQRWAICSPEMRIEILTGKWVRQFLGKQKPSKDEIQAALEFGSGLVWLFDVKGNVEPGKLFELMTYCRRRYSVGHFLIDSLMKVGIRLDDLDGQRIFCNDVATFAKAHQCHVHLIAHMRKATTSQSRGRSTEGPGIYEVRGASDIINQADNIIIVHRNRGKREEDDETLGDATVTVGKQRESGWEGSFVYWFEGKSLQFLTGPKSTSSPKNFLAESL